VDSTDTNQYDMWVKRSVKRKSSIVSFGMSMGEMTVLQAASVVAAVGGRQYKCIMSVHLTTNHQNFECRDRVIITYRMSR
jgi:hypothetical protein